MVIQPVMKFCILPILLLLSASHAQAAEYYRCTNPNGATVFSQEPCGPDAVVETLRDSYIGGNNRSSSRSAVEQLENYRRNLKHIDNITGSNKTLKQEKDGPCANVTSLQLRNARVSKDLMSCHSEDDVRHIYGSPNSVSTWSDNSSYDTRWRFRTEKSGKVYVYFKNGRVTKWSMHK